VNDGPRPDDGAGAGERPPLGGRWGVLYAVVIAALAAEIIVLAWLTERFR